jgi:hypothetical protein
MGSAAAFRRLCTRIRIRIRITQYAQQPLALHGDRTLMKRVCTWVLIGHRPSFRDHDYRVPGPTTEPGGPISPATASSSSVGVAGFESNAVKGSSESLRWKSRT